MASHGRAMDTMCRIDRTARFGGSRCRVNEEKSETRTKFCSLERANCNANRVRAVSVTAARSTSDSSAGLELRRLFRASGRIAGAVGMSAGAGKLALVDDQVFIADRALLKPAF